MRFFPFRKPSLGLSIDDDRLGLVEVHRGWRGLSLRHCAERTLPAGLVRLSASESNVTDVSALAKECSALLDDQRTVARPAPISLSLAALCARAALFEFDTLPHKPSEVDALIRWRFQKDLNLSLTDTRFTYQVFRPHLPPLPQRERTGGEGTVHVLAVSIRTNVIEPYEQACESAGLDRPVIRYPSRGGSLRDFVKECSDQLGHLEEETGGDGTSSALPERGLHQTVDQDAQSTNVTIDWVVRHVEEGAAGLALILPKKPLYSRLIARNPRIDRTWTSGDFLVKAPI